MNLKTKKRPKAPAKKNTITRKSIATKKNIGAKKKATRKATVTVTKKATLKKSIQRKATATTAKQKTKRTRNKITVEAVKSNLPPVEEKSSAVINAIVVVPDTDMKSLQRKMVQNYDKHQIPLSSVKKGGPKPSGKKPLW